MDQPFSHSGARSFPFTATVGFLLVVESLCIHVAFFHRAPIFVSSQSFLALLGLAWLVADYVALGSSASTVTPGGVSLHIGRRATGFVPFRSMASATMPTWQDLSSSTASPLLNATKPIDPNVLLRFTEPVVLRVLGSFNRPVRALAFHVDRPEAFLARVQPCLPAPSAGPA